MGYHEPWNLINYLLGSHDDVGDDRNGNAEDGLTASDRTQILKTYLCHDNSMLVQ